MTDFMQSDYDPNLLAQLIGQQYNPYQGYPLKQVSDQAWQVYGPTPDYLIAQLASQMNPNPDQFSNDAFFGGDPLLRGPLAEALTQAKGDTIGAYNYLQDPEFIKRLTKQIGRPEWDQIAASGDLASLAAMTGEEKDKAALDYYRRGLEDLMAQGAPSRGRQLSNLDYVRQREGGVAKPGTGDYPTYGATNSPGGGYDPMAQMAGSSVDITDMGADTKYGLDRMSMSGSQPYAAIGGRRYAVNGLPTDRIALQRIIMERRQRERAAAADQAKSKNAKKEKERIGKGYLDTVRSGTLVGSPF